MSIVVETNISSFKMATVVLPKIKVLIINDIIININNY